jgi:predicted TIM-barrel fold metal-dependent hydrolase
MMIVDAQVHIWLASTPDRPWPPNVHPQREVPLEKDELLREMNAAGVDRAVIVPPSWEGEHNDLGLAAARAHPDRFAIMGRINPDSAESRGRMRTWREQPGMLGLRFSFNRPDRIPVLSEGRCDWLWAEAEEAGVPVYLLVPHAILHFIDRVAERHPGLRIVMDHLGLINGEYDEVAFRGLDNLLALARRPNVAVKASALPCYTREAYPYRGLHPYIRRVYDAFGPRRMFWGTDLSRLPCSYRQGLTLFTEELPWLSPQDLEWIMGRGVCEWIGWR